MRRNIDRSPNSGTFKVARSNSSPDCNNHSKVPAPQWKEGNFRSTMTCNFSRCVDSISHSGNNLCYKHNNQYLRGYIDYCPLCGTLKAARYSSCYDCRDLVEESDPNWEKGDRNTTEYYVYVLLLSNHDLYVGQTRNLNNRLEQHQRGGTSSTEGKDPRLVWYNTVSTRQQAVALELQLKNMKRNNVVDLINNFNKALKGKLPEFAEKGDIDGIHRLIIDTKRNVSDVGSLAMFSTLGIGVVIILLIVILVRIF